MAPLAVRFTARHRLDGPPARVAAALCDPAFHLALRLPDLSAPEVLDHGSGHIRLRYEFTGTLDPLARRLLAGRRLTWVQELHLDGAGGRLRMAAEAAPDRLHGAATVALVPDGDATLRLLDGELTVAVPLVGAGAERRIVAGILRRLDIEAEALNGWLTSSGPGG